MPPSRGGRRARVAAAQRRLEVRIGSLLGPANNGGDRKSDQFTREVTDPADLTPNQRSAFRRMADHPDIVEDAIALLHPVALGGMR